MGLQFAISFKERVLGDESVRQSITMHTYFCQGNAPEPFPLGATV